MVDLAMLQSVSYIAGALGARAVTGRCKANTHAQNLKSVSTNFLYSLEAGCI